MIFSLPNSKKVNSATIIKLQVYKTGVITFYLNKREKAKLEG
jgi:hypothetical protein